MPDNKDQNKNEVKTLEHDIKIAFNEERLDTVQDLAEKIKSLEPDNHVAKKLLEKIDKSKKKAEEKIRAEKLNQYENMLKKMHKEGKIDQVRELCKELKEFDPDNKSPDKWLEKVQKEEAALMRKANAEKINAIQDQIKLSLKKSQFNQLKQAVEKLKEVDPDNAFGVKYLKKAEKAQIELKQKEAWKKFNTLLEIIKEVVKNKKWDIVQEKANEVLTIEWNQGVALKALKTMAKVKNVEYQTLVTIPIPKEGFKVSFWDKLFGRKKEEKAKKEMVKKELAKQEPVKGGEPVEAKASELKSVTPPAVATSAAPVQVAQAIPPIAPKVAVPQSVQTAPQTTPKKSVESKETSEKSGNVFTRMFGQKAPEEQKSKSIIDTIVAKTDPEKALKKEAKKHKEENEGIAILKFSQVFAQFAIAFIVLSAGFFYTQNLDVNNYVLGLFGIEDNYASQLHAANENLEEKKEEEKKFSRDIKKFQRGYNNQYEAIIDSIIEKRLNWPDILEKINEITDSVYERNALSQYVQYDSFSFDAEKGVVRVSGTLSDPLGKNLTKLAELEEAFRYYPKDKNNPNDRTEPYFYNFQEFKSLSKSYDKRNNKYKSNFQLSFSLKEGEE